MGCTGSKVADEAAVSSSTPPRKGVAFVGKGNSNGVQNESAAARETSDGNLSHVTSGQVEDGKHVAFGPDVTPSAPYNHDGRNAGPIDGKPPRPSRSRRSSGAGGQGIRRSHASSPPGSVAGIERSRKSRVRFEDEPEDSRDRELLRERSTQGRNKTIGTLTSWQLIAADVMKEIAGPSGSGDGRRSSGGGNRSSGSRRTGPGGLPRAHSQGSSTTARRRTRRSEDDERDPMHRDDIFTSIQNLQWKSFGEEYDLGRTMGTGAYGKAMQARCKRDGEKYVVKVVDTRGMSIKSRYEVRNEVRVLSQLNHPNIVKYHEAFFEDGTLYIVMEMCEDGDLTAMIKERRGHLLPEDDVMRIFVQICLGLAHTHSEEVLHRDLKPSNILLSKGNIVKLADFGIARVMSGQAQLAKTVVGTPYYLSPEICEDRPYGTASDMWSLGCVLYELCALRRPFEGSSFPALIVRILSAQYDPIPSTYSRDLRKIIDALLQKRPEDRATLDEILSLEYVREHLSSYAAYIKSAVPKRYPSMRKHLEGRVGASAFESDDEGPREVSTGTEESELEPRKSLGDAVLDPHISAMQAKPARKSRLSMASAHTGHGQQTSSEEEGEEDGSEWQGQRAEAGLTATRAALEKLADDPVLGRVARDEKLAAEVEMTRELAGAIDAMDLSGEGLKRGNSYTGGEMRRIVSRHLNREHRRRKSAEGNRSNTMRSGASHSIGESLAQGTQRDEGTVTDATERKKVGVGVQFASVMHVGKTFLHSMSFGKTASEGVVEQSRIPTGGSNMLPPHRVAGPNRALGAQSPAEKTSTDASRAVSRMSSVNTRQAANVLRQVSVYLQRPSQKYIARSSQVGHALQDRTMERATSRSRPPPVIPRAASMRARLHGDAWGSSSGPGRADPRLRAIARMDSRIAAGRIYERVDSDKPDVAVETVEEACPVSEQPPESPDAAQGASEGREAEDVTVSELSRLDSVRNMTPQELEEKIKMLRAGCLAYIPVPLVEAAIAYMRAINPGVSDAALMSSSTTPPEGVHYNDGVFMRIVNLDREEECKRVWWLVFKICVYEEMLSSRPRGQPALSTANSSRSLGASASGRSMASYSTMGARSAVPSGPSKVSSIASEVIPEDDDESYVQAEREDGGNWQIRHFAVRTYGAT